MGVGEGSPVGEAVGVGGTVSVGDSVGVGEAVGEGVGVAEGDSLGVSAAGGLLGITDGKGCGGGGSEPRSAHSAVRASPTIVARASHVHTGLSLCGGSSTAVGESTGASGSVGSWSAMRSG